MTSSNEPIILEAELMPLVRERLAAGQSVRYLTFRGVSMLPMLRQGIDSVELSPLPEKLKKYDLPLYQYPDGRYVMHRVVGVREDHYLCLGDNTYSYEHVPHEYMIGLVSAFRRGDRRVSTDSFAYRVYSRVWCFIYPLRRFVRRAKGWLRRHLK